MDWGPDAKLQSAVLNRGNEFEESSSVSCRGSTLKNYKTSKSNASIDKIFLFAHDRTEEDLITASSCMCIKSNLEDVAKELNDHAANSVHFPPKKNGPCLNERIDIIMKS